MAARKTPPTGRPKTLRDMTPIELNEMFADINNIFNILEKMDVSCRASIGRHNPQHRKLKQVVYKMDELRVLFNKI